MEESGNTPPGFCRGVYPDWWHPQPRIHTSQRFTAPRCTPRAQDCLTRALTLSDLAGDDSPDTTLLLYYCPQSIKTKICARAQPAPQEFHWDICHPQFTRKRKLQGFIGAATESSPEKGTIKALRFNVTCLIEPLQAQSCIKFPYNYVLGEKQT